ncbi:unnamed protein product [Owenia fusiformis]|uniref:Globin domain-containing protein n=1 Tax=Owenia fusiformis TaxID=6347 RepID=A0A8J1Y6B0_OWEFU|nr:unnamed protein product [Owenia fusiformis]
MICELFERVRYQNKSDKLVLTVNEKQKLKLSWTTFMGASPTQAGLDMFYRMFEKYPETQSVFSFASTKAEGQMQDTSRLMLHITMVSKMIGEVVDKLDNLESIVPSLLTLGGRHGTNGYNIPRDFFPFLGESQRELMKEKMGDSFTDDHNALWTKLYQFIIDVMIEGQEKYN